MKRLKIKFNCGTISFFLLTVSLFGFIFCCLSQFITLAVWYFRINPYFDHSLEPTSNIIELVKSNFLVSMAIFFTLLLLLILSICCYKDFTTMIVGSATITAIGLFVFYGASAFFKKLYLFEQLKIGLIAVDSGNSKSKCYAYLMNGLNGADRYYNGNVSTRTKQKYQKWRSQFMSSAFDENGNTKPYLCQSVGGPTFSFAFLCVLFLIMMAVCCFIYNFFYSNESSLEPAMDCCFSCCNEVNNCMDTFSCCFRYIRL